MGSSLITVNLFLTWFLALEPMREVMSTSVSAALRSLTLSVLKSSAVLIFQSLINSGLKTELIRIIIRRALL